MGVVKKTGNQMKETEGLLTAAQDQAPRTNYTKNKIDRRIFTNVPDEWREGRNHIAI